MGLRDRIGKALGAAEGSKRPDGLDELQVGEGAYDDWDIVGDFADLDTARAWRQLLSERGVEAVLTSDWPLDEFGRGDISLRVPAGLGIEAEEMLEPE